MEVTVYKEPHQAMAIRLLHSDAYHCAKHNIMLPIEDFMMELDQRIKPGMITGCILETPRKALNDQGPMSLVRSVCNSIKRCCYGKDSTG